MIKSDSMLTFLPQYLTFYDLLPLYHFDSYNFESRLKKEQKSKRSVFIKQKNNYRFHTVFQNE